MGPLASLLLNLVVLVTIALAVMVALNRVVFKMAFRNFARRKAHSAIVIAGLMVGTAIISSSLVVGDTMSFIFELDTYRSKGEIDHEVYGVNQYGTAAYFDENVSVALAENLSGVDGIEAVMPALGEWVSVLDLDTDLPEPRVQLYGWDSEILRSTSFGDLDGHGYYPDELGDGEVAINSRLADSLDADEDDILQLSYGVIDPANPFGFQFRTEEVRVAKVIHERKLYGKANYNQRATIFVELDTAQEMFGREGQINEIWVSNEGDYAEGELYTAEVNGTIRDALDQVLGMRDMGLSIEDDGDGIVMVSETGHFSSYYATGLLELAAANNATTTRSVMVPTLALDEIPLGGMIVMGFESTDPTISDTEPGILYALDGPAAALGLVNGSQVNITTLGIDAVQRTSNLTVEVLPPGLETTLPPEMQAFTLGFTDFPTAQLLLHGGAYQDDLVSFVQVYGANATVIDSIESTFEEELDEDIGAEDVGLEVYDVKYDGLKVGREGGELIGTLFLIFSSFAIIAGVVLIVNIFVMLGEERKSEMGMARAVGMRRKHLVRMFVFEGVFYAFVASIVGALLGLGLGRMLIYAFGWVFAESGFGLDFPFHFEWESVIVAFCAGFLLTYVTIFFTSRRISKLNIIRAIRRIPEPRGHRAMRSDLVLGAVLLAVGLVISLWAYVAKQGGGWMAGPPLFLIGCALIAHKWVSLKSAMSSAGVISLAWLLWPYSNPLVEGADTSGMEMFVLSGVFTVLSGVIIVLFNSDLILAFLQKTVGKRKSNRAVLKTAISYPMDSKFKTGMTLGMFALIIFTVTVIAMITAMQTSLTESMLVEQTGGYDIIGFTNPSTPFENLSEETLPPSLQDVEMEQLEAISNSRVSIIDYDKEEGAASDYVVVIGEVRTETYPLLGVSDSFLDGNSFTLDERDTNYSSDREAWQALREDGSLCIVDYGRLEGSFAAFGGSPGGVYVGGTVTFTDMEGLNRTRTLKVIGITDQGIFLQGIFVSKRMAETEYGAQPTLLFVELGEGEDPDAVAKDFERGYLDKGLQAYDLESEIRTVIAVQTNMMYLMQGFLGIGLLVGIAGIGIISYRNVVERRQQIGMLRAIGFKRRMITRSFLIETSFVTILATLLGLLLGIAIGWQVYAGEGGFREIGGQFVVPWLNLAVIAVIAYVATLLFTFYPSLMASRVPPAEALRYIE